MDLVETDFLLAIMNEKDSLHKYFIKIAENEKLLLSPYSLIELNMLYLSKKIEISNYEDFQKDLENLLDYYSISLIIDKPRYHGKASYLREIYKMTYFDSLHASISLIENIPIVSSDPIYSKIKGLKYIHPKNW
jgi:predicted nucleic acid-binding protein